jgi:cyclopropane fatty-acyl-phospholipid synthase-like methyltransferase
VPSGASSTTSRLAVAACRRIAYHYDVGNEPYHLMLYETKSEARFRTRSLRDAQLVLA